VFYNSEFNPANEENKMRFYIFLLTSALLFTACGGTTETPKANTNANGKNLSNVNGTTSSPSSSPATVPNNGQPAPIVKAEAPKVNDAQTLAAVVTAYGEALKTKNDAALKKVLSVSTIQSWEKEMKSEGKTKLAEYIASSEYVEGKPYEVRNEEVKGDEAVAEVKGGSFGVWSKIKFVKENGEWKMTDESPEINDIIKNANTAQKIAPK
jgi:hypothetical protein